MAWVDSFGFSLFNDRWKQYTHNQAMESFKKYPPLPCFFNSSCTDSFSPCLLHDYSRHQSCSSLYLFCIEERCALYHPLLSIPQRDQGSPARHRFSVFFSSHTALFSSGFTVPDNGFQRIHSKFPIFNIRFSSLGNTRSLPTQSLATDCTSRLACHSEGTITLTSQAVVSSWQVMRNNRMILPLTQP